MRLDLGCGTKKQDGYVGMDKLKIEGVDIIHDIENIPWPIENNVCTHINASHVLEHISPTKIIDVMNEIWRVMKQGCELDARTPYGDYYKFDPTHQIEFMAPTWLYFCPSDTQFYNIYKPKPWKMMKVEADENNMELHVIMKKLGEKEYAGESKYVCP